MKRNKTKKKTHHRGIQSEDNEGEDGVQDAQQDPHVFTGSGHPLLANVHSSDRELLTRCSPRRLSTAVEPQTERSDRGTASARPTASQPPLPSSDCGERSAEEKSLERERERF